MNTADRGFTFIMPGFGFLREHFPDPFVVHWEMANGFAQSEDLPGVRIPGAPFMGVMGVAPSHDLLARINRREAELLGRGGAVLPPDPDAAVPATPSIAANAFRTIAPHETGGNIDIKQLTVGATLYLPVYQPGGLFSVGDAHFARAVARIENHYFVHKGWMDEAQLLRDVGRLRGIPGTIVQGRYDSATPVRSAWDLHRAWPEAAFHLIPDAGHAYSEPGILDRLIRATDAEADRLG